MSDSRNREAEGAAPEQLQARLHVIAERHSMSEIARRTGTPLASVSRYFRGTRVPGDFCGALCVHFGVNPSWLITGEGSPWLSDLPERTSAMAGDLLELVESMNAVAHMRLGALAGKHHLRVLRELNEAMKRYDQLRVRLNEHARPVLTRLLEDMQTALNKTNVDRATELHTAIEQVRKFCDEPELSYRAGRVNAAFELMNHNPFEALKHQQRLFRLVLAEGRLSNAQEIEETIRLAALLSESGREEDAVNLCEAGMILAGKQGRAFDSYAFLAFLAGQLMVNNLRLYEGIELMQRWLPKVKSPARAGAGRHVLAMALLYAGLVQPEETFDIGGRSEVKALNLLYFALYREDADYLQRAVKYFKGVAGERKDLQPMRYVCDYAELLLDALAGRKKGLTARFREIRDSREDDSRAGTAQDLTVFETQLLRVLKRKPAAKKALDKAEAALANPAKPIRALLLTRATHHRNALELHDGAMRQRAEDFFRAHAQAGYRALDPA